MRLTLRTLLAYLDNTLEPQDVALLRQKLSESSFATQLVQRIRGSLSSDQLAAPSPQAVGPIDEANVISEYLDSMMPTEQVAEIERACLESDVLLAEVAACHQILTMVLGRKAEVSDELKQRVYELPDHSIEEIAAGTGNFSAVLIPEPPHQGPLHDGIPTADGEEPPRGGEAIQPVGKKDSGVSDAPTRLRESDAGAGSIQRSSNLSGHVGAKEAASLYGGSIRTSRITPWLVSLALAAVFLFALAKIFAPLLGSKAIVSDASTVNETGPAEDIEIQPDVDDVAPPMPGVDANESTLPTDEPEVVPPGESAPDADSTTGTPLPTDADSETGRVLPSPEKTADDAGPDQVPPDDADSVPGLVAPIETIDLNDKVAMNAAKPGIGPDGMPTDADAPDPAPPTDGPDPVPGPDPAPAGDAPEPPAGGPGEMAKGDIDTPPGPDVPPQPAIELAQVTSENTMLCGSVTDGQWVRLNKGTAIGAGVDVLCAPTFRAAMESAAGVNLTLVGPTQVRWQEGESSAVKIEIDFGNVLLSSSEPDVFVELLLGELAVKVRLTDVDSVVAVSVKHLRAPGFDPLLDEGRKRLAGVLVVQGTATLSVQGADQELATGQQWVKKGGIEGAVSGADKVPSWIDAPDPNERTLESTARDGLLSVIANQPVDLSLREATSFRRSEVAALAAQTLLLMGRADAYFGGDGILSEPKQRAHWPDHYKALLGTVDESAAKAEMVSRSIANMDSANAAAIRRLLTGFSTKQLVEGSDEELVEMLDSESMSVRVLALENLHQITGKTLYFRAEWENANRRVDYIDKWKVLQRKGLIRRQQ